MYRTARMRGSTGAGAGSRGDGAGDLDGTRGVADAAPRPWLPGVVIDILPSAGARAGTPAAALTRTGGMR